MIARLIEWWMSRCQHAPEHVTYDVLEGDGNGMRVAHCRRCGSVRVVDTTEPFPEWQGAWRQAYPTDCKPVSKP